MARTAPAAITLAFVLACAAPAAAQDPLAVLRVTPVGALRPSSRIELAFNAPLAGQLEGLRDPATLVRLDPAIGARIEWRDPATLRITPDSALMPGTALTVVVDSFALPDGRRLRTRWTRRWLVAPPSIVGSTPALVAGSPVPLGVNGRIVLLVGGTPDTAAVAARTAFVAAADLPAGAPPGAPPCAAWPADGRAGVRVVLRAPRPNDPPAAGATGRPQDAIDARFDRMLELSPLQPLPEGCQLDLIVGGVGAGDGGDADRRYGVRTASPASLQVTCGVVVDCVWTRRLELISPAPIAWEALRAALQFVPAARVTWPDSAAPQTRWSFEHTLQSRDTVRLVVTGALRDVHGRAVPAPPPFVLPERIAMWSAPREPLVLGGAGPSTIPLRHVGIDSARVTLLRGPRDELSALRYALDPEDDPALGWRDSLRYTVPLAPDRDTERLTALPLRLPDAAWRRGLLGVRIEPVGFRRRLGMSPGPLRLLVQHAELAVHSRVHVSGGAVFVTDAHGAPAAGVRVHALDSDGRRLAAARTDADGLARLDAEPRPAGAGDQSWPFGEIHALAVTRGRDRLLVLEATSPRARRGGGARADVVVFADQPRFEHAAILTDRDLYRPGEMVHVTALVRDGWSEALRAVRGARIRWRLTTSVAYEGEGRTLATREGTTTAAGLASDSFPLPPEAGLGTYRVVLERRHGDRWAMTAGRVLQVTEYRAREVSLDASFDRPEVVRGDSLHATLRASLLLGAPLMDAEVEWALDDEGLDEWTESRPGWSGADPLRERDTPRDSGLIAGRARSDADGTVRLAWPTAALAARGSVQVRLVATVRDLTGQSVSSEALAIIRRGGRRVLIGTSVGPPPAVGQSHSVRFGVVDRGGRWLDSLPVRLTLLRQHWTTDTDGGSRLVHDTLARRELTARDSSGTFEFTPTASGVLAVIVEAVDEDGSAVRSSQWLWVRPRGPDPQSHAFPFALSRDSAQVGDEVTLRFTSPWPDAEAWVVVARDRTIEQRRLRVGTGPTAVPLRIDPRWIPSAQVSVTLVRRSSASDSGPPTERHRAADGTVAVSGAAKRLQVAVRARHPEPLPGSSTTIDIDVRDAAGRPVAGELVLWAVDEGVLALTDYEPPDPLRQLLVEAWWPVPDLVTTLGGPGTVLLDSPSSISMRGAAFGGVALNAVVTSDMIQLDMGGYGAAASLAQSPEIRRRFRTTAFYLAGIRLDASGRTSVPVRLPDGITTYRVIAVAVDHGDRSGVGTGAVVATRPLVARAALPRFVRAADRFAAGVAINARGLPAPLPVAVRARVDGAAALTADTARLVTLDPAGTRVTFDATASRGASARFEFAVAGGALRDGVSVELPVREDHAPEARALVAVVRDSSTLRLALPPDVDASRSRVAIRVGTTPLPVLRAWTTRLDGERSEFTYAVMFTARGLLAMLRLRAHGAIAGVDSAALHRRLEVAVATLVSRVLPDGRVRLWQGVAPVFDDVAPAVGSLLLDARAAGVEVPEWSLTALAGAGTRTLERMPLLPDTTYGDATERRRTIARHLAARLATIDFLDRRPLPATGEARGRPAGTGATALVPVAQRMAFEDRARLARLLPPAAAAPLLEELWRHAQVRGERIDIADSVLALRTQHSRIAPFARLLEATRHHQPDHPQLGPLAQRIIQQVSAGGSSAWNAADYASAVEAIAGFQRSVTPAEGAIAVRDRAGRMLVRSAEAAAADGPFASALESLLAPGGAELALHVDARGAPAYVSVTTQVLRRERPVAAADAGFAVERWYERVRDGRIVTEVEEGELVRVHLRVTADADREFVVVEDALPAGLEIVDPHHRGSGAEQARMLEERRAESTGDDTPVRFPWWRWNPWDHVERQDDRLVIHSRGLPAGTHAYRYLVRATTAGRFVRPQATAQEYFNPGLQGASEGGWFTVTPRPPR